MPIQVATLSDDKDDEHGQEILNISTVHKRVESSMCDNASDQVYAS